MRIARRGHWHSLFFYFFIYSDDGSRNENSPPRALTHNNSQILWRSIVLVEMRIARRGHWHFLSCSVVHSSYFCRNENSPPRALTLTIENAPPSWQGKGRNENSPPRALTHNSSSVLKDILLNVEMRIARRGHWHILQPYRKRRSLYCRNENSPPRALTLYESCIWIKISISVEMRIARRGHWHSFLTWLISLLSTL